MSTVEKNSLPLCTSLSAEKQSLIDAIKESLGESPDSKTPIASAAILLNQKGVKTPKGKEWTSKSLGKYISSNRGWLSESSSTQEKPQAIYTKEEVIRGFLNRMVDALGSQKTDTLLFVAVDKTLFQKVKSRSSSENISVASAFNTALTQWVGKKQPRRKTIRLPREEESCQGQGFDISFESAEETFRDISLAALG